MRAKLRSKLGRRIQCTATISSFDVVWKPERGLVDLVCLQDVMDNSHDVVADHIWIECPVQFKQMCLEPADQIAFTGLVVPYRRGFVGSSKWRNLKNRDYTLSRLQSIQLIGKDKSLMDE